MLDSFSHSKIVLTGPRDYVRQIKFGVSDAGESYNSGNLLALVLVPIQAAAISYPDIGHIAGAACEIYAGSLPAFLTTMASLPFFHSGVRYSQAFAPCAENKAPDMQKNNEGHFQSVVGASLLGAGLLGLSRNIVSTTCAAISTTLHVGGKLGSLMDPDRDNIYKLGPLLSRFPATFSVVADVAVNFAVFPSKAQAICNSIVPAGLALVNRVFWARADIMLAPPSRIKRALSDFLRAPNC